MAGNGTIEVVEEDPTGLASVPTPAHGKRKPESPG
jgi:hypothetical protein